jgi:hypothetical protein
MKKRTERIYFFKKIQEYSSHHPFVKFLLVFLFFLFYFYFTVSKNGFNEGLKISFLTWSFFVVCTPVVGAGLLLDFPLRLLTGLRMIYSEIIVWGIAFCINLILFFNQGYLYDSTILLMLFKKILSTPFPYWIIILLSASGTFLSVHFGDELLDVLSRKKRKRDSYEKHFLKHKSLIIIFLLVFVIVLYYFLLNSLGLNIPLF